MKLKVQVCDKNKESIPCKIDLYPLTGEDDSVADRDRAETVYSGGRHEFEVEAGAYAIECQKGKLFVPARESVIVLNEDVAVDLVLEEIIDTRSLGLYAFDAHSHVTRNERSGCNPMRAADVMKAEGFHFFFAGSPYDAETLLEDREPPLSGGNVPYRERFRDLLEASNNENFTMDIGNEIVKCRYGHTFLMNYEQKPPFSKYYDRAWDPWLFTKIGDEPSYEILYPYEALAEERGNNSVAVAAHPTSWWDHKGEFITNIATTLGFDILARSIDAMVVMGYDADHVHYQKLWYEVLNQGYFMPGVAEMDLTFDALSQKHLRFKTYAYADSFHIDALCTAVKAGRNIVTTGPIVQLFANGQGPGSVFPYAASETFRLRVEAVACYQAPLSRVQLIVGGEVWKEYEANDARFEAIETLSVDGDSFVLAKVYDGAGNVAMTNPVYFRNKPFENEAFKSNLTVHVAKDGQPAEGAFWIGGQPEKTPFSERIDCRIDVAADVHIEVDGVVRIVKLFELEELQAIFKNLYFGYFNEDRRYAPGEVPASAFELGRIKEMLSKVDLRISF
ncbi:CehA/McbA family metallohydrolase [Cohnella sp. GbtcB17]|uniref:CehA/McbA family metallohydrolase n=1 Tax=Cohnella sp. GbtcB17 TaxID=2824762 RepID=UPI001C2FB247|nr:CehA/McbA family metallohydrolase [Cohnella sp. GbtcB17]